MARSVKQTVRLSEVEQAQLLRAAKDRGYLNPTALIRAAIRDELAGREIEGISAEQRIAATLERLSREIFRVHRGAAGSVRRPGHAGKGLSHLRVPEPPGRP